MSSFSHLLQSITGLAGISKSHKLLVCLERGWRGWGWVWMWDLLNLLVVIEVIKAFLRSVRGGCPAKFLHPCGAVPTNAVFP